MTELTRKCLQLHKTDRKRLVKILTDSLKDRQPKEERFKVLYDIATDMMGNGILTGCRNSNLVIARRMIAYQLKSEGYSWSAIGRFLVRHHAAVIHMWRMMDDAIRYEFKPELTYWQEFQRRLKEYETDTRTNQRT